MSHRPDDATTLDGIFRLNARRRPQAVALIDPPDRTSFTDGDARTLTYAQADAATAALAARLHALELPPGCTVALQFPNIVESAVAMLGVLRGGFVPALLPLLWGPTETARALTEVSGRALIVCGRVAATPHAELALHAAAGAFGVRYVCGFGTNLPDGIVPLDGIWNDGAAAASPFHTARADDRAAITFEAAAEGFRAVSRTHGQLLAGGLAVMLEANLPRHAVLLATLLPSSFAMLAATLTPWLLSGGTLAQHQPFDGDVLSSQIAELACDAVMLPGPLVEALAEAGIFGQATSILALWRAPGRQASSPPWRRDGTFVDLLAFGETGVVPLARGTGGMPRTLPLGPVQTRPNAPMAIATTRTAHGTLALSGPMVAPTQAADTGYPCRFDPVTSTIALTGPPPGVVSVGGYSFALNELRDVIGRIDPTGTLAALPDLLVGQKLVGAAEDMAGVRRALAALGVTPLLREAFRERSVAGPPSAA